MSDKGKNKGGRPSSYTDEIGREICETIAHTSKGLRRLCEEKDHWPNQATIYDWRERNPQFDEQYVKARQRQADFFIEEIMEISDSIANDIGSDDKGNPIQNTVHVQRSRLRVDTRKWIASKVYPKYYGDKVENNTTVTVRHEDSLSELE